jgi:hypothetical protein
MTVSPACASASRRAFSKLSAAAQWLLSSERASGKKLRRWF